MQTVEKTKTERQKKIAELTSKIGTTIQIHMEGLQVSVKLLDVRPKYGRIDLQITPINGGGIKWISSDKL